ncbi:MAG: CAP domain-containing protein [Ilumatobacteraceae bacterium]
MSAVPVVPAAAAAPTVGLIPVDPSRDVDTRVGLGGGRLAAGETRFVELATVPDTAVAAVINVTAVEPSAAGHITVTDCTPGATTSVLNHAAGGATPNQVTVGLPGDDRRGVCVTASSATHLLVDVVGHVAEGGAAFVPRPGRTWDTREDGGVGADGVLEVDLAGSAPSSSTVAWSGTITATGATTSGYVTAWACAGDRPQVSNVNFAPGVTTSNHATVAIPASDPRLCLHRVGPAELVIDTSGSWEPSDSSSFSPFSPPRRYVDTRADGALGAGEIRRLHAEADATLFANLTATRASNAGWVALFPCDRGYSGTSTLNVRPGRDVASAAVVSAREGGVCVTASVDTDLVLDAFAVEHPGDRPPPADAGVPLGGVTLSAGVAETTASSGPEISVCILGSTEAVDLERAAVGLHPVIADHRTDAFACEWATEMASAGRMSHSSPDQRASVDECGMTGETVAVGSGSWETMMAAWLESPEHRSVALHPSFHRASVAYVSRDEGGARRWYGAMVFGGTC